MKNQNKIILAAAIGGAGFLIYKNWDKISKLFKKKDAGTPPPTGGGSGAGSGSGTGSGSTGGGKTYSAYELKVMKLQGNIGAAVDGNPGTTDNSQTNRLTKEFFPNTYARLGRVTTATVDSYLALGTKKEILDTSRQTNNARADLIEKAWVGSKSAIVRGSIDKNSFEALTKDNVTDTYKATGGWLKVKPNTVLDKANTVRLTTGYFATIVPTFYADGVSPTSPEKRLVKIPPTLIDVV